MDLIERIRNRCYLLEFRDEKNVIMHKGYVKEGIIKIRGYSIEIATEPLIFKGKKLYFCRDLSIDKKANTIAVKVDDKDLVEYTPKSFNSVVDESIWRSLLTVQKIPTSKLLMYFATGVGIYFFAKLVLIEFLLPIVRGG